MKRITGFTLIELLIVVAIIAILAAIAVPNFLEAQIRSKVARVKADQRSLATALETYFIDNNSYPAWAAESIAYPTGAAAGNMTINCNYNVSATEDSSVRNQRSFAIAEQNGDANPAVVYSAPMFTMTTPIAYITSYPQDPFMTTRSATFGYYADPSFLGWILYSVGPDTDQIEGGDIDNAGAVESVYSPFVSQPSGTLITLGTTSSADYPKDWDELISGVQQPDILENAFTYDPTNGTTSDGDVSRVKS